LSPAYTLFVPYLLQSFFLIATIVAALPFIYFGYIAATESISRRTVRASLIARLSFCLWLCLLPSGALISDSVTPTFADVGQIESVQITNSTSKHFRAYLRIKAQSGGYITLHVSDRSSFFRAGQYLQIRYQSKTGELFHAKFLDKTGKEIGGFHHTAPFSESICLLVGAFCIWASIRKFGRDSFELSHML
jgi:hypothetical protein